MTLLALPIGNDVTFRTQIIDDIHFAWQAQYSVRLEGDFSWQAQYLVRLEGDFSWQAQYLVRLEGDFSWQAQHFVTFWEIAGARNVVFYNTKSRLRSDREGLRSGGCEMTILSSDILGYPRIILDYPRIVFLLAEALQGVSAQILSFKISWQAQYLLNLKGDFTCSGHWK